MQSVTTTRAGLALAVWAAALAVAGCGTTTTIDKRKAEAFVRSTFLPQARSASCPGGVEAKKGKTFTCTAVDAAGQHFRVVAHVVDSSGRVSVNTRDVIPVP